MLSASERLLIVGEARDWIGTPFRHCAAAKGAGTDCIGLLIGCYGAVLGLEYSAPPYSRQISEPVLKAELAKYFEPIDREALELADVVLLRVMGHPQHVAIWTGEGTLIHAHAGVRKVAENSAAAYWDQIEEAYTWRQ